MLKGKYYTLLVLLLSKTLLGQDINFEHFTIDNGLNSNTVYSIYEDDKEGLWFCTDKGINIYNGSTFSSLTTKDGLGDNEIFAIYKDKYDRKWLHTYNGNWTYIKGQSVRNVNNDSFIKRMLPISKIFPQIYFDKKSERLLFIKVNNPDDTIYKTELIVINKDNIDNYDLGSSKDIPSHTYFYSEKDTLYKYDIDGLDISSQKHEILVERIKKYFGRWCGVFVSPDRLIFFNDKTNSIQIVKKGDIEKIVKLENIIRGKINWAILREDILIIASNVSIILKNINTNQEKVILNNTRCNGAFIDKLDNIWISTTNKGVYKTSFNQVKFFINNINNPREIVSVIQSDLDKYLILDIDFNLHLLNNDKFVFLKNFGGKKGTIFDQPLSINIIQDKLVEFNGHSIFYKTFKTREMLYSHHFYKKIDNLNRKDKFFGGFKKAVFQLKDKIVLNRLQFLTVLDNNLNKVPCDFTNTSYQRIFMVKEYEDKIYFTSSNGIYSIQSGVVKRYQNKINSSLKDFVLFKNYIIGLSNNDKILIFDTLTLTSKSFLIKGVPASIYKINDKLALILSNIGLYYLELSNLQNPRFLKSMHKVSNKKISFIKYIENSNSFFIVNNSDIHIIPEHELRIFNTVSNNVVYKKLYINKQKEIILDTNHIFIPYAKHNQYKLLINDINLTNQTHTLQYQLNNDEWTTFATNEIPLFRLRTGENSFRVRSLNENNYYKVFETIYINVQTPFWLSKWFLSLVGLLLILLIYFIIRQIVKYYLNRQQRKYDREIKFLHSEFKTLNSLMNPHFIFNSLNNIQSFINYDNKQKANLYLSIFSKIVRQNYENIQQEEITLRDELNLVKNYLDLEKMRFEEELDYSLIIENNIKDETIKMPPLIVQPLVENAIKHGLTPIFQTTKGVIRVKVYKDENGTITINVEDNGIGLVKAKNNKNSINSSGTAIRNIKARLIEYKKIHDIDISIEINEIFEQDKVIGTKSTVRIFSK